jgi:hypothetical protein
VDDVASLYSEYLNTILYPNYVEVWQAKATPQEFSDKMASQTKDYWTAHPQK